MSPGSFYLLTSITKREEALGMRLHEVLNGPKKVNACDNALVRINSALIVFKPCFNIASFCAIKQ